MLNKYVLIAFFSFWLNLAFAQINASSATTPSTCSSNGSITVTATGGTAPYYYQITASTSGIVRPVQNVNVFQNLPAGSYTIRISDGLNESVTSTAVISGNYIPPGFTHTQTNSTVRIFPVNGRAPYTYSYSVDLGQTFTTPVDSGIFHCMRPGLYLFRITDSCENFYSQNIVINPVSIQASFTCQNFNSIALNSISGGNGDYVFNAYGSGFSATNTTGNFSNIGRCNTNIRIAVTDRCNVSGDFQGCTTFDYNFDISCISFKNNTVSLTNVSGGNGIPRVFFANGATSNTPVISNIPVPNDTMLIGIRDSCGYSSNTVQVVRLKTVVNNLFLCEPGKAELTSAYEIDNQPISFPPTVYTSISGPTAFSVSDSFSTGISGIELEDLQTGWYTYKVTNACNDEYIDSFYYTRKCFNQVNISKSQTCNSILYTFFRDCQVDTTAEYTLYDENNIQLDQNRTGIFSALDNLSCYKVTIRATACDTVITDYINPVKLKIATYENNCGLKLRFTVSKARNCGIPAINPGFSGPVTYVIADSSFNILQTSGSGDFDTTPRNAYWVWGSSNNCNTDTIRLIPNNLLTDTAKLCISPTVKFINANSCRFAWNIQITNNALNKQYTLSGANYNEISTELFNGADTGSYILSDGCNLQQLYLPALYSFNAEILPSVCPNNAAIRATATVDSTVFYNGRNYFYEICNVPIMDFTLQEVGSPVISGYTTTGLFTNLKTGTYYGIYFRGNRSCNFYADTLLTPFYIRPSLNVTYGLICNGNNATVKATVENGTAPYRFEVLNTTIPDIVTDSTTALYTNLPLGTAQFRVSDACGVSMDYSTEVLSIDFQPTYKKRCDGSVQLIAPDIFNTTYIWKNNRGDTIGTAPSVYTIPDGSDTFTVSMQHLNCVLNKTVVVENFSAAIVDANAGPDRTVDTSFTVLQGNIPPSNASGTWTQINPSSGNTTFSNNHQPDTEVNVDIFPGIYTYVWTLTDTSIGCISEDTVTINFLRCPGIEALNYTKQVRMAQCSDNGQIAVQVTNSTTPLTYNWNTGDTTAVISNLAEGMYIVTVNDFSSCTPDIIDTTYITSTKSSANTVSLTICEDDTVTINQQNYFAAGTYFDTLVNNVGCDSLITIIIQTNPVNKYFDTVALCSGESYTLPDGRIITQPGTYNISSLNSFGCDSSMYISVFQLFPSAYSIDTVICLGTSYQLPNGNMVTMEGTYRDTLTNSAGCDSIVLVQLIVKDMLQKVNLGRDTFICIGDNQTIHLDYPEDVQFVWQDNSMSNYYEIREAGIYAVTVSDNCTTNSDTIVITEKDCSCTFYVPTAFSPNNDGINDIFVPFSKCVYFTDYHLKTFNRWGDLVFQTTDSNTGWDGSLKDNEQPLDNYIWVLEYFDVKRNEKIVKKGIISLLR
jgi:gliding motility-associated-like protein